MSEYGFIQAPYRRVIKGKPTDEIVYLDASKEEQHVIAQANAELDAKGKLVGAGRACAAAAASPTQVDPAEVDYMDVAPEQIVSVATALIPFLEHDDANRALMGSNMQRQAVPLMITEAPLRRHRARVPRRRRHRRRRARAPARARSPTSTPTTSSSRADEGGHDSTTSRSSCARTRAR